MSNLKYFLFKVEYHANVKYEYPLKTLGFYIRNSNKKLFYNRKYIAKITIPITKPVFGNYTADIYWNEISRKIR